MKDWQIYIIHNIRLYSLITERMITLAKAPMYKGKEIETKKMIVGRLLIEDKQYFIENATVGIKKPIILKSLSTATKKELDTFIKNYK